MKVFAALFAIAALIVGAIYIQVAVWSECRETNSFLYCLRLISK